MASQFNPLEVLPISETYFEDVIARAGAAGNLRVQDSGPGRGKGIYATADFAEGDVIFRERPLAGMQHVANQADVQVCSCCHRFIGTVEQQIARILTNVQRRYQAATNPDAAAGADAAAQQGAGGAGPSGAGSSGQAAAGFSGGSKGAEQGSEDEEEEEMEVEDEDLEELKARHQLLTAHVTAEELSQLASGQLQLPLASEVAPLPTPVPCVGGCEARFCSAECAQQAWQQHHCLLCPGPSGSRSQAAGGAAGSSSGPSAQGASEVHASSGCCGLEVARGALPAFYAHAAETNDIFVLAAKCVAITALRAARLMAGGSQGGSSGAGGASSLDTAAAGASSEGEAGGAGSEQPGQGQGQAQGPLDRHAALQAAWQPLGQGWKALWWECVAVPEDCEEEEGEFRGQIRELAQESLSLLTQALPGVARAFPELLSLEVWGGLVGMFELNNLALAVPSPVEDFFLAVDDLPKSRKAQVQAHTAKWLDALDKWYDTAAEGTGFFALQSCANHSCAPNAATEGEADGRVAVYALRRIKAGEEVTLSYIEEGEDAGGAMSYKERQAALKDYGFTCQCSRCLQDLQKRVQAAKKGAGGRGVKTGRR